MQSLRLYLILLGIMVAAGLTYLLAPVLKPFLFGAVLAYMGNPFVSFLARHKVPRVWGVALLFVILAFIITLIMLAIIPRISEQIQNAFNSSQQLLGWIQASALPWFDQHFGSTIPLGQDQIKSFLNEYANQSQNVVSAVVKKLAQSGLAIMGMAMNILIATVATFYLMRDWPRLFIKLHALMPLRWQPIAHKLGQEMHQVLQAFFRGTLLVMLVLTIIYSIGLSLIRLNVAIVVAVIAGILSIVPYLGLIIGLVMAMAAAAFQFGDIMHCVWVGLVFAIAQVLSDMVLQPILIGDKIGLHPLVVIFSIFAGEALFGFMGILLSIPAAAVINVLLVYAVSHYLNSRYYKQI